MLSLVQGRSHLVEVEGVPHTFTRDAQGLVTAPAPAIVVSSFAVFEPELIGGVYDAGRKVCGRDQLLATRFSATTASPTTAARASASSAHTSTSLASSVSSCLRAWAGTFWKAATTRTSARVAVKMGNGQRTLTYLGAGDVFGIDELWAGRAGADVSLQTSLTALGYVDLLPEVSPPTGADDNPTTDGVA